jgi:hypothetical protein
MYGLARLPGEMYIHCNGEELELLPLDQLTEVRHATVLFPKPHYLWMAFSARPGNAATRAVP